MSNLLNHHRWHDTAQKLFDGTLSDDETAAFADLLASNAEAYEFYRNLVQLEVELEWHCGSDRVQVAGNREQVSAEEIQVAEGTAAELVAASADCTAPASGCSARQPVSVGWARRTVGRVVRPAAWSVLGCAVAFAAYVVVITWGMLDERLEARGTRREARGARDEAREKAGKAADLVSNTTSATSDLQPTAYSLQSAKLLASADAEWSISNQKSEIGDQQSASPAEKPLKLVSGLVELQLKQGVKLLIQGPADWTIDGANHATLHRGKLVARVPRDAIGFTLKTPTANIVDMGTEFGVEVNDFQQTDVAVTSGIVQLSSSASPPDRLTAGQSARFAANGDVVQRSEAIVTQFDGLMNVARSGLSRPPDLWVYESFDAPRDAIPLNERLGGDGFQWAWIAPIGAGIGGYPAFTLRKANIAIGPCFPKGVGFVPTPGIFEHCDASGGLRRATCYLPKPVDLGTDGEYFISFVAAKYGNNCHGTVGLVGNSRLPTIEAGWTYSGGERPDPFVVLGPDDLQATSTDTGMPSGGDVLFFVLRVVARAEGADLAVLYVFRRQDMVPANINQLATDPNFKPYATVALPEFDSSHQLQYLLLNVDGPSDYIQFDEIRMGTSWQAVTGTADDS